MNWNPVYITPSEAVSYIKSGDQLFFGSLASVPMVLVDALIERARRKEIKDITIRHLKADGHADYASSEFAGVFSLETFFVGDNTRPHVHSGNADYIPVALSQIGELFRSNLLQCDVALIQVSPPDNNGMVSLGPNVDINLDAIDCAKLVIAVVNKYVPHTQGDALLPIAKLDLVVQHDTPMQTSPPSPLSEIDLAIGRHCAELVKDGDCLQLGIGGIPNAVLSALNGHKNLGIHSEMLSDGVLQLVESGVINGSRKQIDREQLIVSFLSGSQHLYDFAHGNSIVQMRPTSYTNDPFVIAKNDNMVSINSALQIDLTGQVSADSLGTKIYSGVGGQLDFIYGAARSKGGRAIIAISSTTPKGLSKISDILTPGSGVVTPRSMIHYFITEYGAVELFSKSLQHRARAIINIAHPDHREMLEKKAFERFGANFLRLK